MTPAAPPPNLAHVPSLSVALAIMLVGTLYPPLMADAQGRADHDPAGILLAAGPKLQHE